MESSTYRRWLWTMLSCVAWLSWLVPSALGNDDPGSIDYQRDVKPLLATHCYACHGALKQSGSLRLDTAALAIKGGDSGPALVARKSDDSLIVARVTSEDASARMPPEGKPLTPEQINLLQRWIESGAEAPIDEAEQEDPLNHWAFQPPRQRLPSDHPLNQESATTPSANASITHIVNPIDAWLSYAQSQIHVQPLGSADKHELLRRVTLDLIGLPPTGQEIQAFISDTSADAYERVVERLLSRPEYGERWGRHWMDVWRYSDWYGRRAVPDVMNSYPQIWRWRDWIVRSLNEDKGYDQMVMQMIAADELTPTDPDNVVATGFIVRNWYKWNYETWMKDSVEHTGKAFLGLTLNCAMCHDHKYDPITQEDYFRFRAFFEPLELRHDRVAGEPDPGPFKKYVYAQSYGPISSGAIRIFDEKLDAQTFMFRGGDARNRIEGKPPVDCGPPRALTKDDFKIESIQLPAETAYPGLQDFVRREELEKRQSAREAAYKSLQTQQADSKLLAENFRKLQAAAEGPKTAANYPTPDQLQTAQLAMQTARLQMQIKQAAAELADAQLESLRMRIAADDEQRRPDTASIGFAQAAFRSERIVDYLSATHSMLVAEDDLVQADNKASQVPTDKPDQVDVAKKAVKAATDKLQATRVAVDAARTRLNEVGTTYQPLSPKYPAQSTGRRTALARWLTSADNTLTARVAVNHMWLRHFGSPLVESVDNFGLQGKRPLHPELLDWLAVELVRQGWSMKALHRLMVTSAAYRRSSHPGTPEHTNYSADRDNRTLWYFPPRRMEAEVVRDSVLACAGALDNVHGGPEIVTEDSVRVPRRSIYFVQHGEAQMLFLSTFDGANVCECYRRTSTVLPSQALALTNSELLVHYGRVCAARLNQELDRLQILDTSSNLVDTSSNSLFVKLAFERLLGRAPTETEMTTAMQFLAELPADVSEKVGAALENQPESKPGAWKIQGPATDPVLRARENLVMALFNHTDFVTIR